MAESPEIGQLEEQIKTLPDESAIKSMQDKQSSEESLSENYQSQAISAETDLFNIPPPQKQVAHIPAWEDSQEYKKTQLGKQSLGIAFGLFVAALAGPAFMKTGANGAMLALTSAINGWKSGRDEVIKQARDDYDKHIKFMINETDKLNHQLQEEYNNKIKPLHERVAFLNLIGRQYGFKALADARTIKEAQTARTALLKSVASLKKSAKSVNQRDFEAIHPDMVGKDGTPEYATEYKAYLDKIKTPSGNPQEQAKLIGDAIINGKQSPIVSGFGMSKLAAPLRAYMAEKGYDLKQAELDFGAQKKFLSTLNGQQQLRLRQAITFTSDSLSIVEDLAKQWDGGKFPLLNRANLIAAKNGALGPKAQQIATKLDTQVADLTSELGTVYKGGNSSTDESLKLAAQNLNGAWSKEQLLSNLDLIRKNLAIRKNSIETSGVVGTSKDVPRGTPEPAKAPLSDTISQLKAYALAGNKKAQDYLKSKGISWQSQQ